MDAKLQKRYEMLKESDGRRLANIERPIAKGVALLDEKAPGWAAKVNVGTLNMRSPNDNLLSQIGFFVDREQEVEYGFYLATNENIMEDGQSNWAWLNILWKEEIAKRLAQP